MSERKDVPMRKKIRPLDIARDWLRATIAALDAIAEHLYRESRR